MAGERRTKSQKFQAQQHRIEHELTYSYRAEDSASASSPKQLQQAQVKQQLTSKSLFAYDTNLIYGDLKKTILITIGILAVLVVIKIYFH